MGNGWSLVFVTMSHVNVVVVQVGAQDEGTCWRVVMERQVAGAGPG